MPDKERKSEEMRRHEERGKETAKASPQKPQQGREGQTPHPQQKQPKTEPRMDR